ncbi:uncharacterized protein E0L32_005027 [Thyridium curvatum]|uniref:Protein kinase domain-containing protein n=1 Tax=Thyridium curvatum TaxID=1093900 RepID=A0A507BDR7_9PEZI|nr:uncharacterized protein E0L32_005027 [Thyridium curvatum]TPX14918.1 hypothetical protein E0L32_005027 [Thyridium curvatum]
MGTQNPAPCLYLVFIPSRIRELPHIRLQFITTAPWSGSSMAHTSGHTTPQSKPAAVIVVGIGITGRIELLSSRDKVKKSPHPSANDHDRQWMHEHIKREIAIYQRLPKKHSRFIQMVGYSPEESDHHIIFEYLPKRDLRTFLDMQPSPSRRLQLQWALDAAEAVGLVHACDIIHSDIKPSNFLVDEHLRLRLIDFSGSSIDDQPALVVENARFFLPRNRQEDQSSVLTDLFALGSTIYEIMTTQQPYEDLDEEEVEARYIHGDFPGVEGVVCGDIINKCWTQQYAAATAVYNSIEEIMRRTAI